MDCREIQADLSAYIDRELAPEAQESIRLHLGVCEQCSAQHAKLLRGWQALDAWEDVTPPEQLRKKILESARPQRKVILRRAWLSVAAALVLIFGVTVYFLGQKGRSMPDVAKNQSPVQTTAVGDISEDEIIANLLILQENDFFEALDELVKIDDLLFSDEPSKTIKEPERSSLDMVFT